MKNDKRKILFVHNFYKIFGGEDTVVKNEIKLLRDNGYEVYEYYRDNKEISTKGVFNKIRLFINTIYSFKTCREIKKIIKEKEIDIVHCHNTFPLVSPSVYRVSKKNGAKVVQTIHNFRFLCPKADFYRNNSICEECLKNGLKCSIKNRCYHNSMLQTLSIVAMLKFNKIIGSYKKVDKYIALTEFNKNKFLNFIEENKIVVKPNFSCGIQKKARNIEECEYFVYFGRISEEKGIYELLDVFNRSNMPKLVVIGSASEEIIRLAKDGNVEFVGFKNHEELFECLQKAYATIVSSKWYECFPMTILESFSFGIPVVANNIGNMSIIIKDGYNGILYNSNDELETKIKELYENKILLKNVSENAKKEFEDKYTREKNFDIIKNIYGGLYEND